MSATTYLLAGWLIDGSGGPVQEKVLLKIVDGRFAAIEQYVPGGGLDLAQVIDLSHCSILPPLVVADLGAGEGLLSELLARRCKRVIAVDNSEKIVAFGAAKAKKNGLKNLDFRLGDLQNPPVEGGSVDLVILSQALHHAESPAQAVGEHRDGDVALVAHDGRRPDEREEDERVLGELFGPGGGDRDHDPEHHAQHDDHEHAQQNDGIDGFKHFFHGTAPSVQAPRPPRGWPGRLPYHQTHYYLSAALTFS